MGSSEITTQPVDVLEAIVTFPNGVMQIAFILEVQFYFAFVLENN